jgi:hypothetical protein
MSIELDKRSINHLFGGWGSARNGKLTREWSLMTLLLLISKGRLVAGKGRKGIKRFHGKDARLRPESRTESSVILVLFFSVVGQ